MTLPPAPKEGCGGGGQVVEGRLWEECGWWWWEREGAGGVGWGGVERTGWGRRGDFSQGYCYLVANANIMRDQGL